MKKAAALLIAGVLGAMAIGTIFLKKEHPEEVTDAMVKIKPQIPAEEAIVPAAIDNATPLVPDDEDLKPVSPWDYHQPLTKSEKEEFKKAEAQVQKFLTWGKMDPEAVPAFRQTLFKMGDRAIADLARGLSQITKDDIHDKASAEAIVHKIDALGYFANSQNPLAADSAAYLAKRPITWNENGELLNPVEANITFEMFDLFARYRPGEAAQFIKTIDKKHRAGYFTHYAYGRKLAGRTMEEIDQELRNVFGSPELALK